MGFSGSGSNVTRAHTHDSTVIQDGGSLAANVTQFGLSSGSILYSDGSNIQELGVGAGGKVLAVSGSSLPEWVTPTDTSPLIKVSKTYADIVLGTTSMEIYTLPQDAALVNIYTDITTVFDISTAVTIGDAGDDNGFTETTDWTSGTGLTDATRGAYVTSFKTMRSTSGTTAISAYNFSTTTTGGTTFTQTQQNDGRDLSGSAYQEIAQQFTTGQVLIGENIASATFYVKQGTGSPTGDVIAWIRQADGTAVQQSSTTLDSSTITASYVGYTFDFPNTTLSVDDMITIDASGISGHTLVLNTDTNEMTDGLLFRTTTAGDFNIPPASTMVGNQMRMDVLYGTTGTTTDTQGEVDFYLQVVD